MIIYLLSKLDSMSDCNRQLSSFMQKDIENKTILFIPTSPEDRAKTKKYAKGILEFFQGINIKFEKSVILHSDLEKEEVTKEVKNSSVVFLMGGNTLSQYDFIVKKDLQSVLEDFEGVIVGLSAGAINACKKAIITPMHEVEDIHIYNGLGLVNISVEVHFEKNNLEQEQLVLDIAKETGQEIYCIPDFSGIRIKESSTFFLGEVYRTSNNKIVKCY